MKQIDVVGLSGDSPLSLHPSARMALEKADILYGSERQLALVPGYKANYRQIPSPFSQLQAEITQLMTPEHAAEHMVLLASGDPLFYGIGGWLTRWIKGVNLCFHPQPSAIQLAFSRIGKPWEQACVLSVHGRPLSTLRREVGRHTLLAVLTDNNNHPIAIAQALVDMHFGDSTIWVAEDLETRSEKVSCFSAKELAQSTQTFSPLNVIIIETRGQSALSPSFPGLPNTAFSTGSPAGQGMLTKREVRLAALAQLQPPPGTTGWDIGAGCGGLAVEWARWSIQSRIYAIETNPARLEHLHINQQRFGVESNLQIVAGRAPDALQALPTPHSIYLGGSQGQATEILAYCWERLAPGGRIVIPAVTLETRAALVTLAQGKPAEWLEIAVASGKRAGPLTMMQPQRPVLLLTLEKS